MVSGNQLTKNKTAITVIALVVVSFYVTGLYKNMLEIKNLNQQQKEKDARKNL